MMDHDERDGGPGWCRSRRGEIAQAMMEAAWPPAPVAELCQRALVSSRAGRYTASRLIGAGELVVLEAPVPVATGGLSAPRPRGRPASVVASREALARMRAASGGAPSVLQAKGSFWETVSDATPQG